MLNQPDASFQPEDTQKLADLFDEMITAIQVLYPIVESYDHIPLRVKGLTALSDFYAAHRAAKALTARLNNTLWLTKNVPTVKVESPSTSSTPSTTRRKSTRSKDAPGDIS